MNKDESKKLEKTEKNERIYFPFDIILVNLGTLIRPKRI